MKWQAPWYIDLTKGLFMFIVICFPGLCRLVLCLSVDVLL